MNQSLTSFVPVHGTAIICCDLLVTGSCPVPERSEWYRANSMNFYHVYILISQKDNQFYIGFSTDVFGRVKDHNAGMNISTAKRGPFDLIYFESFLSKADALRREGYFKTTKGKVTLRQMLREYLKDHSNKNK